MTMNATWYLWNADVNKLDRWPTWEVELSWYKNNMISCLYLTSRAFSWYRGNPFQVPNMLVGFLSISRQKFPIHGNSSNFQRKDGHYHIMYMYTNVDKETPIAITVIKIKYCYWNRFYTFIQKHMIVKKQDLILKRVYFPKCFTVGNFPQI